MAVCRAFFWFGLLLGVGGGHVFVVVGNFYEIFSLNLIIDPLLG